MELVDAVPRRKKQRSVKLNEGRILEQRRR